MKTILAYHTINNPELFENQLKFLEGKDVLLTVDDGDISFYENAYKIILKYDISCILFIITSLIDSDQPFWWDEIEYYLGKVEGNKKVWEVKGWPNKEREAYLEELRGTSAKPILKYKQLTTSQLREMQDAGIIIANHSHTHPLFDQCTQEELETEMVQSLNVLKESGFTSDIFAYPNGNYSQKSEEVLKKFGVKKAFLFDHKINRKKNFNPLRISRLVVNDTTPMWKFKLILSGWHTKILPVTKMLAKLKKRL
ncbi:polysaccharide deacetylase family protein [Salegentibacter sp. JZCK2]|uniref:polysaccharide deacetylase family protein n=1 Tax=Salegentibacter tibetensis TaxID=2873600 RepID=UPI001CCEC467|nr:polysaccharide deacetylase family protein [Salegentibacter tibetensis]MBZ9729072.1 polysaccharide deacetylase family protein [Salegentibacter tibetensis]